MSGSDMLQIILAVIGSSSLTSFFQFLITRKDKKSDTMNEVITKIDSVDHKVDDGFVAIDATINALREDMNTNDESLRSSLEAAKATTARVRILRASDEIRHKMRHSKEWFDQLNDDITFYETYCRDHPEFVNNKAKHAIDNINAVYAKALKENDFL